MNIKGLSPIGGVVFISAIATLITASIDIAFVGYSRGVVHNTTLSALNLIEEMEFDSYGSADDISPILTDYIGGALVASQTNVFPSSSQIKLIAVKYQDQPGGKVALWQKDIYGDWSVPAEAMEEVVGGIAPDDGTSPVSLAVIAVYEDQAMTFSFCEPRGCELILDRTTEASE